MPEATGCKWQINDAFMAVARQRNSHRIASSHQKSGTQNMHLAQEIPAHLAI
jgi:hypothetical protein